MIVGVHDASFGQQTKHGSQQGYLVMLGETALRKADTERGVHLLDWGSSKIHRVVRSTLAAEAASASHAHDRATYARVLLAEVLGGNRRQEHWTTLQRVIDYSLASDCRSLVEHCAKTGASVSEKRVGLDIADVRASVDAGDTLEWLPTDHMPADSLTKHLTSCPSLAKVTMENLFRLKWPKDYKSPKRRMSEKQKEMKEEVVHRHLRQ